MVKITDCLETRLELKGVAGGKNLTVDFDGGEMTSDGGVGLIAITDRMFNVVERLECCFEDLREMAEHLVVTMLRQRIYGICLGYPDVVDHDRLRFDQSLAAAVGKDDVAGNDRARESDKGAPLAGKSTLNRLELSKAGASSKSRYGKIVANMAMIERLLVDLFLDMHTEPPDEIILDIDPTDVQLHGSQQGRYFHAYYDGYCFLPQYVFCGDFVLASRLRPGDVGAMEGTVPLLKQITDQIHERWSDTRIIIRGDSHFCSDDLMSWCESTPWLDYIVGMPGNSRLENLVHDEQQEVAARSQKQIDSGEEREPVRTFVDLEFQTEESWSTSRRVVAKVEHLPGDPGETVSRLKLNNAEQKAIDAEEVVKQAEAAADRAEAKADRQQRRADQVEQRMTELKQQAPRPQDRSPAARQARDQRDRACKANVRCKRRARKAQSAARKARKEADKRRRQATAARDEAAWKAEQHTWPGKSNTRYVVTSIPVSELDMQTLYEEGYCPRGDAENRIKEQQLYLFADCMPCRNMRANQLRLYFSSFAYTLDVALRQFGLAGTKLERAQCHTIREQLFKIGGLIQNTSRRVWVRLASSYPHRKLFWQVIRNLKSAMKRFGVKCRDKIPLDARFA